MRLKMEQKEKKYLKRNNKKLTDKILNNLEQKESDPEYNFDTDNIEQFQNQNESKKKDMKYDESLICKI